MAKKGTTATQLAQSEITVDNLLGLNVETVEFGVGAHLMGQKLTLSASRGAELKIADKGILAKSESGRVVLLPWANLRCVEIRQGKAKSRPIAHQQIASAIPASAPAAKTKDA